MTSEPLTPERTVRLLRAKAGELETLYKMAHDQPHSVIRLELNDLRADLALIAALLADQIERSNPDYGPQFGEEP